MNYSTTFTDSITLADTSSTYLSYNSIIDLMNNAFAELGIPISYMAEVKNINVNRLGLYGVYVMNGSEPQVYWHNWANMYKFLLQLYGMPQTNFEQYDEVITEDIMFKLIGAHLTSGGEVIGYATNNNWRRMIKERGISFVEYQLEVLVLYPV